MTHRFRAHTCTAHDRADLRGLLWECDAPAGLVVIRTPYGAARHASTARSWVERGYHCLVQDVRGRYRSAGVWRPYRHEADDGRRLLERLGEEYPSLPVVAFGASYAAHTALEATRAATSAGTACPAAVIVLVPALGLAETAWDENGVPQTWHRIGWWHQHGRTPRAQPPLPAAELHARTADVAALGVVEAARRWGWTGAALDAWTSLWTAERTDLDERYGAIAIPLLVISGTEDFFDGDARRLAASWRGGCHLASGPWGHDLVSGIADTALRDQIRRAGGLSHVIDPWLAAHALPGSPAPWTELLDRHGHTRSRFDPADGRWHHERTAP